MPTFSKPTRSLSQSHIPYTINAKQKTLLTPITSPSIDKPRHLKPYEAQCAVPIVRAVSIFTRQKEWIILDVVNTNYDRLEALNGWSQCKSQNISKGIDQLFEFEGEKMSCSPL